MQPKKRPIKAKISPSEFESKRHDYEIKRIGKRLFIVSKEKKVGVSVSRTNIEALSNAIEKSNTSTKIKVTGLSRAQISRIAGDLQEKSSRQAFIKKNDIVKGSVPQPASYEILIKKEG